MTAIDNEIDFCLVFGVYFYGALLLSAAVLGAGWLCVWISDRLDRRK